MFHPNPLFHSDGKPVADYVRLLDLHNLRNHDRTIESICNITQEAWYKEGKLRADIDEDPELLPKKDATMILMRSLGFVAEVLPTPNTYFEHALVLGAKLKAVRKRLALLRTVYLEHGIRIGNVHLIGNHRGLSDDETGQELLNEKNPELPFRHSCAPLQLPAIEAEMMNFVYGQAMMVLPWTVPMHVLSVPDIMGKAKANTNDTLQAWKNLGHKPGKVLVVSSNPFVSFQGIAAQRILGDSYAVECIGYAAPEATRMSQYLDNVAKVTFQLAHGR